MTIKNESQKLNQKALVTLFLIDASRWGLGTLRFSADKAKDGGNIIFNGNEYINLPIEAEGFEVSNTGQMPTPTLRFLLDDVSIRSILLDSKDLLGAPVVRFRIFEQNLDDGEDPDPDAKISEDYYFIEQKVSQTKYVIEFELKTLMDLQGLKIPRRVTNKRTCTQTYRVWDNQTNQFVYSNATCPYAGTTYYDSLGNQVFDAADDVCGKRLSDCQKRFGQNNELPYGAFPSLRNF